MNTSPHSPPSGDHRPTNIFTSNISKLDPKSYKLLLAITYICLFVGSVSSSLLIKFYFIHNGSSRWVSTWVQSAGFPILLIPIFGFPGVNGATVRKPFSGFDMNTFALSVGVGLMLVVSNLCFSWGNSYLPLSTAALVLSSQLVFTLLLSVIIVREKITFLNLNCVIVLTLSCILLAISSSNDRPEGLTNRKYFIGFFATASAGLLFAFYLPVMERVYRKVDCYAKVMEMQLVMEGVATVVATVAMAVAGGFREMREEGVGGFDLGVGWYRVVVGVSVVTWHMCFMGTAGMVFMTTSVTGGICMTALMGMNVVGGVVVFGDEFKGPKVVSTVLCFWGFSSYVYGMYVKMKEEEDKGGDDRNEQQEKSLLELSEIVSEDQH